MLLSWVSHMLARTYFLSKNRKTFTFHFGLELFTRENTHKKGLHFEVSGWCPPELCNIDRRSKSIILSRWRLGPFALFRIYLVCQSHSARVWSILGHRSLNFACLWGIGGLVGFETRCLLIEITELSSSSNDFCEWANLGSEYFADKNWQFLLV